MVSTNAASAGQVLQLVRRGTVTTRGDVGRVTGLSRTAVSARLAALVGLGLIGEAGDAGETGVGRPPGRLHFNADAGTVLAAAVGRSRTQLAVCDLSGAVLDRTEVEQEVGLGPDDVMPRIVGALAETLGRSNRPAASVRGIGVSIPGAVDPVAGASRDSPIMSGWHGVGLATWFEPLSQAPVSVDNDTNVVALSERTGHLLLHRDAVVLKASTGLGAGIVAGGLLQRGSIGAAGELGHVKYRGAEGRACRCGDSGCLESVAGGWALVQDLRSAGHDVAHIRDVVALALDGELLARRALRASGRQVGEVLAAAVTLLNPSAIVVGGDMAQAYELFAAGLRETLYRDSTALTTRDLQIVPATYGEESGVRGCAMLALDRVLSAGAVDAAIAARR